MPLRTLLVCALSCAFATAAAAQAGTLDKIRSTGTITLGYINDAAPFSSVDAKGEPQGYSVDLCREIARGIGAQLGLAKLETRWVALTIQNRLEAVSTRKVDLECSTTTWTLSRQRDVDFSLITFVDGGSVLTRAGSGLGRLADLNGKRVAVIKGTTTERALRDSLARYSVNAQVLTVNTRPEGLKLVEDAKAEGFAADRTTLVGALVAKQATGAYRLLDEDFSIEPYVFTLPTGDHEYRIAVNRVLARLFRSGDIAKVYDRWLGPLGPPSALLSATYFVQGISE
ncbi:MAG TPA: amino acid ABC transporter substrate-binding protein [Burkholderiales bacterium]|nr:amino acid ABC transporter substrate-binding protein [Burkholderiales bacterium]